MRVTLRTVSERIQQKIKAGTLLWVSPGLLLAGNMASTLWSTAGGVMAFAGIFSLVAGLVMLNNDGREDVE